MAFQKPSPRIAKAILKLRAWGRFVGKPRELFAQGLLSGDRTVGNNVRRMWGDVIYIIEFTLVAIFFSTSLVKVS
jgi:hypothetical protein